MAKFPWSSKGEYCPESVCNALLLDGNTCWALLLVRLRVLFLTAVFYFISFWLWRKPFSICSGKEIKSGPGQFRLRSLPTVRKSRDLDKTYQTHTWERTISGELSSTLQSCDTTALRLLVCLKPCVWVWDLPLLPEPTAASIAGCFRQGPPHLRSYFTPNKSCRLLSSKGMPATVGWFMSCCQIQCDRRRFAGFSGRPGGTEWSWLLVVSWLAAAWETIFLQLSLWRNPRLGGDDSSWLCLLHRT